MHINSGQLEVLYKSHGPMVYNLVYKITGNPEDARDLTQETFVRVYENLHQFRGESNIKTWIYTIAKNLCMRSLKKRKSFTTIEELTRLPYAEPDPGELTDKKMAHLAGQVREGCLLALLQCLTRGQRLAFVLHVFARLSMAEVGEIMGKSVGAVKVLVHRARRNLKAFLCANCSVYDRDNPCKCVNLVGFSLKQGWIHKPDNKGRVTSPETIEAEIREIRDIAGFYRRYLGEQSAPETLAAHLRKHIQGEKFIIFEKTV